MLPVINLRQFAGAAVFDKASRIGRIASVDAARGLAMALMALDHCRDFFTTGAMHDDPTNPATTHVLLFFTRWATHWCAPAFVFLAGTAVAFSMERGRGPREKAWLLVQRGLLLILLELTLVRWAWLFGFSRSSYMLQVLWMLGAGMIVMAALLFLPDWFKLFFGLALLLGHNALDSLTPENLGVPDWLWMLLHAEGSTPMGDHHTLYVLYPLIPWIGVMPLGYLAGRLYRVDSNRRSGVLAALGCVCLAFFFVLRLANGYGDPQPWSVFADDARTVYSFLDVTKYPPSLEYLLATLGTLFLVLAYFERPRGKIGLWLTALGKAPLFFYVVHLYLLHAMAVGYALLRFGRACWLTDWGRCPAPPDAGASLAVVYVMWLTALVLLFPACRAVAA